MSKHFFVSLGAACLLGVISWSLMAIPVAAYPLDVQNYQIEIGRVQSPELKLVGQVSRHHLDLIIQGDDIYFRDAGSRNGTDYAGVNYGEGDLIQIEEKDAIPYHGDFFMDD